MTKAAALLALGPLNLARVGAYRLGLKSGLHPVQKLKAEAASGPFFSTPAKPPASGLRARRSWRDASLSFSWFERPLDGPPDWLANAFDLDARFEDLRPWWTIPDFDPVIGDIKTVWEASRFDWLIAMAQRAAQGDTDELARLNAWLADWGRINPPYLGPNWKCGQEASIRVMHLALAAMILGGWDAPLPGLKALVRLHLRRIAPTMGYALGQQNNHGTSEAAALFIGGSWLERAGEPDGARLARIGRRWLEERARVLIEPDGTFSQYSVAYQRVMIDTYSLAEAWRRRLGLPGFSDRLYERLTAAVRWLYELTDATTGDAPNLGANDGARLIALTDTDYRDFRPSVQLAAALLAQARAFSAAGDWDQPLAWLGIDPPATLLPAPRSRSLDDGGLHILRTDRAMAVLNYSRFRFRPSQADALHLDFRLDGINLLRDGGSYSYSGSEAAAAYFSGAKAHNLVEVDGRDQMPRVSRFLFGAWLRAREVAAVRNEGDALTAAAGYRDAWGAEVLREIRLEPSALICRDTVGGRASRAILRWRLAPGDWTLSGGVLSNGSIRLTVESSVPVTRLELIGGEESRYYLKTEPLPVLEVEVSAPCALTTRLTF
ncbi:heparinase II/III family protein [Brevundimonas sp.]|uniref:heparinase II/III family protein n=1 Tax=Brevundimonas sp. TaxID=1871086 RepID=UPI002FC5B25A